MWVNITERWRRSAATVTADSHQTSPAAFRERMRPRARVCVCVSASRPAYTERTDAENGERKEKKKESSREKKNTVLLLHSDGWAGGVTRCIMRTTRRRRGVRDAPSARRGRPRANAISRFCEQYSLAAASVLSAATWAYDDRRRRRSANTHPTVTCTLYLRTYIYTVHKYIYVCTQFIYI